MHMTTERCRIQTLVRTVNPLRGSVGPKFRTCLADVLGVKGSGARSALLLAAVASLCLAFAASPVLAQEARFSGALKVSPLVELKEEPTSVTTLPPTAVSGTSATLKGRFTDYEAAYLGIHSAKLTACAFEYRTEAEPSYGQHSIACSPPPPYGEGETQVEATLSVLPNNAYQYRLVLTDASGASFHGSSESFSTTVGAPRITAVSAVVNQTKPAGQTEAKLSATIFPDSLPGNETTYHFEYGETTSYGTSVPLSPEDEIGVGDDPVPVTVALSGLKVGTTYHYRVVASNELGSTASPDQTFTTLPPALVQPSVSDVASTSATLNAQVDPLGSSTACESLQYVSAASFQASGYATATPVPCLPAALGAGESYVEIVPQHIDGLTPGTVYRYRLSVANALGTVVSEATFTTQGASTSFALPDGREWEQVSPPDKHGAGFYRLGGPGHGGAVQASVAGDAVAVMVSLPSESEPQGYANQTSVLSTRSSGGWSSHVIAPPHAQPVGPEPGGEGSEYRFFSADLSHAIVQPRGATLLSSEASEQTAYLRNDALTGGACTFTSGCYTPLVTRANDTADPFQPFGEEGEGGECETGTGGLTHVICGPFFLDATPDLSHVILRSQFQLTATRNEGLYEWGGGQLQPLDLMPASEGGIGVYAGPESGSYFDATSFSGSHELSADGSVFFSYGGHLYLHDFATDDAVRLVPQEGAAEFLYASADGSKVLFRDEKQLTPATGGGVYECRIVQDACGELLLTGLSVPGELLGGSEDATYLYFLGAGEKLSVAHYEDGRWTMAEGPVLTGFSGTSYRVSPNGRWFAFMSNADLTGYDTADANSGQSDEEVYLYDAQTGKLVCASCNPTGARPVGIEAGAKGQSDPAGIGNGEYWVASGVPRLEDFGQAADLYQPRYLSDSGRLFFDSNDALVPQDVNGTWDVYEYEPEGVPENEHACSPSSTSGSDVFEPAHAFEVEGRRGESGAGCVALISSGTSPEESSLLDASESGGDVFFLTQAQLSPTDTDTATDVYDAHECTSESPCIPPPAIQPPVCETEASCKQAPTPQPTIYAPPASATFSGPGNVTMPPPPLVVKPKARVVKCKKGFAKDRLGKCVKAKKARKARRASADQRTRR